MQELKAKKVGLKPTEIGHVTCGQTGYEVQAKEIGSLFLALPHTL